MPNALQRQRTLARDQGFQRESVDVFHRVVEQSVRRVAIVVDLDGVRMPQLADQPNFAFEARCLLVTGAVPLQDLDRRGPFEQRVAGEMHGGTAAFRQFALEPIGADAPARGRLARYPRECERRPRGPTGREHQKRQHAGEREPHVAQRCVGLVETDLRHYAHALLGKPAPRADHFGAAVVAIGIQDGSAQRRIRRRRRARRQRRGYRSRERPLGSRERDGRCQERVPSPGRAIGGETPPCPPLGSTPVLRSPRVSRTSDSSVPLSSNA